MTKQEMISYGVPEDRVREFSKHYHKDIRELAARDAIALTEEKNVPALRAAIMALLPTLKTAEGLRKVLRTVNSAYHTEDLARQAAAEKKAIKEMTEQEAVNHD